MVSADPASVNVLEAVPEVYGEGVRSSVLLRWEAVSKRKDLVAVRA